MLHSNTINLPSGIDVHFEDLCTRKDVLDYFETQHYGGTPENLKEFTKARLDSYGSRLIYHIPDGLKTFSGKGDIVLVKEGFLYLPINEDPTPGSGSYVPNEARLLDYWEVTVFFEEFGRYAVEVSALLETAVNAQYSRTDSLCIPPRVYSDIDGKEYFVFYNSLYGFWPICVDPATDEMWRVAGRTTHPNGVDAQVDLDTYARNRGLTEKYS